MNAGNEGASSTLFQVIPRDIGDNSARLTTEMEDVVQWLIQ